MACCNTSQGFHCIYKPSWRAHSSKHDTCSILILRKSESAVFHIQLDIQYLHFISNWIWSVLKIHIEYPIAYEMLHFTCNWIYNCIQNWISKSSLNLSKNCEAQRNFASVALSCGMNIGYSIGYPIRYLIRFVHFISNWISSMHNEHTSNRIGYPIGYKMDRLDNQLGIQLDIKTALPGFCMIPFLNTHKLCVALIKQTIISFSYTLNPKRTILE